MNRRYVGQLNDTDAQVVAWQARMNRIREGLAAKTVRNALYHRTSPVTAEFVPGFIDPKERGTFWVACCSCFEFHRHVRKASEQQAPVLFRISHCRQPANTRQTYGVMVTNVERDPLWVHRIERRQMVSHAYFIWLAETAGLGDAVKLEPPVDYLADVK